MSPIEVSDSSSISELASFSDADVDLSSEGSLRDVSTDESRSLDGKDNGDGEDFAASQGETAGPLAANSQADLFFSLEMEDDVDLYMY